MSDLAEGVFVGSSQRLVRDFRLDESDPDGSFDTLEINGSIRVREGTQPFQITLFYGDSGEFEGETIASNWAFDPALPTTLVLSPGVTQYGSTGERDPSATFAPPPPPTPIGAGVTNPGVFEAFAGGLGQGAANVWNSSKLWDNSDVADTYGLLREQGSGVLGAAAGAFGGSVGEQIGVGRVEDAWSGRTSIAEGNERLSAGSRLWRGSTGLLQVGLTAAPGAKAATPAIKVATKEGLRAGLKHGAGQASAALNRAGSAIQQAGRAVYGKLDDLVKNFRQPPKPDTIGGPKAPGGAAPQAAEVVAPKYKFNNGGCFVAGTPIHVAALPVASSSLVPASASAFSSDGDSATAVPLQIAIEDVPLGARVDSTNPELAGLPSFPEWPEGDRWVVVRLRIQNFEGKRVEAQLLRPAWWAESMSVGDLLPIYASGLEVRGHARVLAIEAAVTPAEGPGNRVTGRFITRGVESICGITLNNGEHLKGTPTHPFWAASRGEFVPMGELAPGDQLLTDSGLIEVLAVSVRAAHTTVYNIEVENEHVYQIGLAGVLVHNVDPDCLVQIDVPRTNADQVGSYTNTHASGSTYSGKGTRDRSQQSGRRIAGQYGDQHIATDFSPAENVREAFKQESRRIDAQGGVLDPSNYNQIESPGRRFRIEDGELFL
ncbi:hypothetical protein Pla175_43200 [Pirellulimonas nuda]|uniref:Uncharacterized protein n=1 Tax=Pirellulimonas nuda TaxID=2528009 RepID=A0A518DHF9_9BACT|nr:Hint domain-containing protein [Pirellulimonas nuda]QDU90907.1 hypothetical protein Pla175_43200 [Pirellulimonas nuda]